MELMARHGHDDEWDDDLGWIDGPAASARPASSGGGGGGDSCEFCIG